MVTISGIPPEQLRYQITHYEENSSPVITIASSIFFALALILVFLRFLTKTVRKLGYHEGDHLIVVAMVLATGLWIEALLSVKWGTGKHSFRVYREQGGVQGIAHGLKVLFAFMLTYNCAHLAIKLSILFFYRRMFTLVVIWFRWAWYFVVSYVVATWIVSTALVLNQCRPISSFWDQVTGMPGECDDLRGMEAAGSILAIADLMLLVLPLPILASLKRPMKERIMLSALFVLGSLTFVASIARIVYIARIGGPVQYDFTYVQVDTFIWSAIEVDLGIICACIPTVKPLFTRKHASQSSCGGSSAGGDSKAQTTRKESSHSSDEHSLATSEGEA